MKKYNSSWDAEELQVNFNQKQWRQDLASYVSKNKFWFPVRVTRAKVLEEKTEHSSSVKEFSIYDCHGNSMIIRFMNKNDIIYTDYEELLAGYLKTRKFS